MIQIDMEMPKGCNSCPIVKGCSKADFYRIEPRPKGCPLKGLPKEFGVESMSDLERKEEELFIEAMINLWVRNDAPQWIVDYVRKELRKQRGLSED